MAGSAQSNDENGITGINVTPLVDVMLVLLIIFMVTANLINNKAIAVNLPPAGTAAEPEPTAAKVEILVNGDLLLDHEPVTLAELTDRIAARQQPGKPLTVSIAADRAATHGKVIDVVDALRKDGVYDFSFDVAAE